MKKFFIIILILIIGIFGFKFSLDYKHKQIEDKVIEYLVDKGIDRKEIKTKRIRSDRQGIKKYEVFVEIKKHDKKYYYVLNDDNKVVLDGVEGKDGIVRNP